ncbi:MAG TPA: hypothetical protein VK892_09355 [Pyrinomonadaceae bacterium]|nr:hypothetical protein [Pyrinomonadaceae bacterium]
MSIKLQQPIISGSLRVTNFFNGRLVTGADMFREQNARREAVWRVGKAAGEGIVYGLEVERETTALSEPLVSVSAGLAVNRCGQTLYLAQDTTVNLLQRFGTIEQPSKIFGECKPVAAGTYAAGFGLYLLVLSPAETSEGSAPTSGLKNAFSTCNTDVVLETAQFRLLAIDPFLTGEILPAPNLLRNYIAYKCFGTAEMQEFFADPIRVEIDSYGLIDKMREKTITDSDVPLAIINWTSSGIQFVEMWAVRRRMTRLPENGRWSFLASDRRQSESEAMFSQFADHIRDIRSKEANLHTITAVSRFSYFPPVGLLPVKAPIGGLNISNAAASAGFAPQTFFGQLGSKEVAMLDAPRLRRLIQESFQHDPVDLKQDKKVRLYLLWENVRAVETGSSTQLILIFTKQTLPYSGTARFGYSEFDLSRFAEAVV